jgi:hypothetical protein
VREEFKVHFAKSPCLPKEATIEQLADRSKISTEEKLVLSQLRVEGAEIAKRAPAAHRQYNLQTGNELAMYLERSKVQSDKISLDFYEGRITRGEYNKRRLDLATQIDEEGLKIARAH